MNRVTRTILLLAVLACTSRTVFAEENENTSDEAIMRRELEWAESTMEGYKRVNGKMPIRSAIAASHVHTDQWKNDSMEVVQGSYSGSLRGMSSYV
jgi:hypothetical protein